MVSVEKLLEPTPLNVSITQYYKVLLDGNFNGVIRPTPLHINNIISNIFCILRAMLMKFGRYFPELNLLQNR